MTTIARRVSIPLVSAVLLVSACSLSNRAVLRQQGEALRPPWLEPGPALRQARAEALAEARLRLWGELMQRSVAQGLTLEQAVLIAPALESRLRGEIACLTPAGETVSPDGVVTVTLTLDARRYESIVRRYWKP